MSLVNRAAEILSRRKVFISYYHGDRIRAQDFVDRFGRGPNRIFNPKAIGWRSDDELINSNHSDSVMETIRDRLIVGSTVHIVLIGRCTHSRRYIDWEINRSLRNQNGLSGAASVSQVRLDAEGVDRGCIRRQSEEGPLEMQYPRDLGLQRKVPRLQCDALNKGVVAK